MSGGQHYGWNSSILWRFFFCLLVSIAGLSSGATAEAAPKIDLAVEYQPTFGSTPSDVSKIALRSPSGGGELTVTVRVTGHSPLGVKSLWWWLVYPDGTEGKANWYDLQSTSQHWGHQWPLTLDKPGTYKIMARCRDAKFGTVGEEHQSKIAQWIVEVQPHPDHSHAHNHPHDVDDHHHHPHVHPHRPGTDHHHPY